MNITTETIREAHAREVHPSQTRVQWDEEMLTRAAQWDDTVADMGTLLIRVTYQCPTDTTAPDTSAGDFGMEAPAGDASVRDARDISRHADVYGVALYAVIDDNVSGYPLAVFSDGQAIML